MNLSVLERLVLLNVLPREGTITTVKIVRELREALSFSEEEHKALKFHPSEDGGTEWDEKVEKDKEVAIGPKAHVLIAETLELVSENKKLTADYLSVWEKFIDSEGS